MSLKQPLFWHQGLFLQPQHLQYADQYHQSLAVYLLQQSTPYCWGLLNIEINESALQNGILEIGKLSCVLREGVILDYPNNAALEAVQFVDKWRDTTNPLKVFIGLRLPSQTEPNVTVYQGKNSDSFVRTRYASSAEGNDVLDAFQSDKVANVKTLRYSLALFFDDQFDNAEQYELLPIAQIIKEGEQYKLDESFVPPLINGNACPPLINKLNTLKHDLLGRASLLESYRSVGDGGSSSYNPAAITNQLAGQVLARYVPRISQLIEAGEVHPLTIYGVIRELIGELSTFSNKVSIEGESRNSRINLLPYLHDDFGQCMEIAIEIVAQLLNELTVSPELVVQLKHSESGKFSGSLTKEFFERQHSVYLLLRTAEPFDKHLQSFMNFSKLGADNQVDVYARRALPGVPVIHLQGKPIGISSQPNTSYFMIERDGYEWGYVEDTGQIGLIWNEAPSDLVVELVLVRG